MSSPEITLLPEVRDITRLMSLDRFVTRAASWGVLGITNADRLLAFGQVHLSDDTQELLRGIVDGADNAYPQQFDFIAPVLRVADDIEPNELYAFRDLHDKGNRWDVSRVWATELEWGPPEDDVEVPDDSLERAFTTSARERGVALFKPSSRTMTDITAVPVSWPSLHPLKLQIELEAAEATGKPRTRDVQELGRTYFYFGLFDPLSCHRPYKAVIKQALLDYDLV